MTQDPLPGVPEAAVLCPAHREHLRGSGLTDATIAQNGFYTETDHGRIKALLNQKRRGKGQALVLPTFVPGEDDPRFHRIRPDKPRKNKRGKPMKYEQPFGVPTVPYFPAGARSDDRLLDPGRPLILTEGEKKAALLDQEGYVAVAAVGVDNFHDKPHRDERAIWRLHPLLTQHVTFAGRQCLIAFDSDARTNGAVWRAAKRLAGMVKEAGGIPRFIRIPDDRSQKLGIDDFFVKFGADATRALLGSHEPIEAMDTKEPFTLVRDVEGLFGAPVKPNLRIPLGYEIDIFGGLHSVSDDDGSGDKDTSRIERSAILIRRVLDGLYTGEKQIELVFRDNDAWRTCMVSRRAISDRGTAIAELTPIGGPIDSNTAPKVVTWLRDFEHINAGRLPRQSSVERCGWHGSKRFMLGETLIGGSGEAGDELVFDARGHRARLCAPFTTRGSYEKHLDALKRAWAADPIAALAICGALAAPLLGPLEAPNFAIHLAGDSSRGKSSMLKIAASVYASPLQGGGEQGEWIASWNATAVSHEVRAAAFSDLPLCIDEAGVADGRDREKAIYMLVNGQGRTRGHREGGLRETPSWRTIVLSTGEAMLTSDTSATGAQVRVLQHRVAGFGDLGAAGVDDLRCGAEENFGHVGREWLEALAEVDDWVPFQGRLKAIVRDFQAQASNGLRGRQGGFYALLAAAEDMASRTLGLGVEGGATMRALFMDGLDDEEGVQTASERAVDLIADWMRERPRCFLELEPNMSGKLWPKVRDAERAPQVLGFIAADAVLLIPRTFKEYLGEHGIDARVLLGEWQREGKTVVNESGRTTAKRRVSGQFSRFVAVKREVLGVDDAASGDHPIGDDFSGDGLSL